MRKPILSALRFAMLIALTFSLFGCPTGLDHPLSDKPDKIDPELIGRWSATTSDAEMTELVVKKKDDFSFHIEVLETSETYALDDYLFTGWITRVDGHSFLYAQPTDSSDKKYYQYHYHFEDGMLVIQDMGLVIGGVDAVTSTAALRKEVSASLKEADSLSGRVEYIKN